MGAETGQLHAGEAERLIGSLRAWGVERVGSCEWTQQQEALQRLNAQVSSHRAGGREGEQGTDGWRAGSPERADALGRVCGGGPGVTGPADHPGGVPPGV